MGVWTNPLSSYTFHPLLLNKPAVKLAKRSLLCLWSCPTTMPRSFARAVVSSAYLASPALAWRTVRSFIDDVPACMGPRRPAVPNAMRVEKRLESSAVSPDETRLSTSARVVSFCR